MKIFNISSTCTCINNHYKESSVKSPYINPYKIPIHAQYYKTQRVNSLHVLLRLSLINKCKARWKHRLHSI